MPLTAPQLRHLEQFKQCTGCKNTKTATEYLKNYKWNIERAVQEWYAMYGDEETGSEGEEINMQEQKLEREAEEVKTIHSACSKSIKCINQHGAH